MSKNNKKKIIYRYSLALFKFAVNKLDVIEKDVEKTVSAVERSEYLKKAIASPLLSKDAQFHILNKELADANICQDLKNFILLLIDSKRINLLLQILKEFLVVASRHKGFVVAEVISFKKLDEQHISKISQVIESKLNKKIYVKNIIKPSIIGGIIVKIESIMVDGTISNKINRFKKAILASVPS